MKKTLLSVIFPTLLFSAAIFPFNCNFSRDGGVFRSDNEGLVWQQEVTIDKSNTIGTKDILSMTIDKANPNIIYLGTQSSGLWRSTDGAASWKQIIDSTNILDRAGDVSGIFVDPRNSNFIYLDVYQSSFGRILSSQDNGSTWQQIYITSKSGMYVNAMEVDNSNTANIYAGISDGTLLKSSDFGASWQTLKLFDAAIYGVKVDPRNGSLIYVIVKGLGVYKSSDSGSSWILLNENMKDIFGTETASMILIDPRSSNILYVKLNNAIITSEDGGQTWKKENILVPANSVAISTMAQDQLASQNFYYAAGSVFYKTVNGGQSWTPVQLASSRRIGVIAIDPMSTNIIYVGMHQ